MKQQEKEIYLIAGLGNPGKKYQRTYHNLGFLAVEEFLRTRQTEENLKPNKNLQGKIAKFNFQDKVIVLLEPQTFMNLSGQAVVACAQYFKIPLENILIIQDDSDLSLGKIRLSFNSGAGGHNGIKSIIEHLGSQEFARLRIGIQPKDSALPENKQFSADQLVLKPIPPAQNEKIATVLQTATEAIESFLEQGFEKTANKFN